MRKILFFIVTVVLLTFSCGVKEKRIDGITRGEGIVKISPEKKVHQTGELSELTDMVAKSKILKEQEKEEKKEKKKYEERGERFIPEIGKLPMEIMEINYSPDETNKFKAQALNMMSTLMYKRNRTDKAAALLEKCIELDSENPYYYAKIGFIRQRTSALNKESIAYFEKAAEKGSQDPLVYYTLGRYFKEKGDTYKQVQSFEKCIALSPSLVELSEKADFSLNIRFMSPGFIFRKEYNKLFKVYKNLHDVYQTSGNLSKYLEILVQLSLDMINGVEYKIELSQYYLKKHEFQKSLKLCNGVGNIFDLAEDKFLLLVSTYTTLLNVPAFFPQNIKDGIYNKVIRYIDTYLSIREPSRLVLWAGITCSLDNNNSNKAVQYIDTMITDSFSRDYVVRSIKLLIKEEEYEKARAIIKKLDSGAWGLVLDSLVVLKGSVMYLSGSTEEGIAIIDRAVKQFDPASAANLLAELGSDFVEWGKYSDAVFFLKRGGEKAPANAKVRSMLAYAMYKSGDLKNALSILEDLLKKDLDDKASIENMLGYLLAVEGKQLARSIVLIKGALKKHPGKPQYLDSLGWAYFKSGDIVKAGIYLKQSAEKEASHNVHDHLGEYYLEVKEIERARKSWIDSFLLKKDDVILKKIEEVSSK